MGLSLVVLVTAKIYFFHLYRRPNQLFINKNLKKISKSRIQTEKMIFFENNRSDA